MALTQEQYTLLTFIEQEYSITGLFPSKALACEVTRLPEPVYDLCLKDPAFTKAVENRGIRLPDNTDRVLTTQQLNAVATMMDRNDTRSDKKKLQDLDIPSQTWQGWLRDPVFKEYYNRRAESLFGDMLSEAPRALRDNINRGDLSSIKYVYEMTGRYSEKNREELPLDFILQKVMESLTRHITDPHILMAVSEDLMQFAQKPKELVTSPNAGLLPVAVIEGGLADV